MTDKIVAFVLYAGLTPLDLIGPLQVMTGLEVAERIYGIEPRHHVVVVAEHLDAVPTDTPVRVAATSTLDESPAPDIVYRSRRWRAHPAAAGEPRPAGLPSVQTPSPARLRRR